MSIILPVGSPADTTLHTGDHLVPDTSMLPDIPLDLGDTASRTPDTVSRTADAASRTTDAAPAVPARTPVAWVEGLRHTVSGHPLAAMAAAFVLGSMVTRLRR